MAEAVVPLRLGIVGLGFGASVHLPVLKATPGVEVVCVAGRDVARAAAVARDHDVPYSASGVGELLTHDLDAVTFALPPLANEEAVRAALDLGVPVLCEKPLAASAAAAVALAASATGRVTAVDFLMSELHSFRALHDAVRAGQLGRVRSATVTWFADSWAQRSGTWSWKTDAAAGGGVLPLLGSHALYLFEWLLGPLVEVTAVGSSAATERFAPAGAHIAADSVSFTAHTAADVLITATLSNAARGLNEHRWHVVGAEASVTLTNTARDWMSGFHAQLHDAEGSRSIAAEAPNGNDGRFAPFAGLTDRFLSAVRGGECTAPDFRTGARVQVLMEAVAQAAAERAWVPIP